MSETQVRYWLRHNNISWISFCEWLEVNGKSPTVVDDKNTRLYNTWDVKAFLTEMRPGTLEFNPNAPSSNF